MLLNGMRAPSLLNLEVFKALEQHCRNESKLEKERKLVFACTTVHIADLV